MYLFVAHYINMETDEERAKAIEIEGQFFENEKAVYTYAMGVAFDGKQDNECFDNLEFIAC